MTKVANTTIELTPAELAYIETQRAAAEAAIIEKRAKAEAQLKLDIEGQKRLQALDKTKFDVQNAAARHFYLTFPTPWKLIQNTVEKTYTVTGEYVTPENPAETHYDRVIVWSETVKYTSLTIEKGSYKVYVSAEAGVCASKPYMTVGGIYSLTRKYTRAKTILKKIKEIEAEAAAEIAAKAKSLEAKQTMEEKITALYPSAQVKFDTEWVSNGSYSYRRRGPSGYNVKTFTVTFPNGYTAKCRYYDDCSVMLMSQGFTLETKDTLERISILSKVQF